MIYPDANPCLNVPDIFLLLLMCLTWIISCCVLHMWWAKSGKCPVPIFQTFSRVHVWERHQVQILTASVQGVVDHLANSGQGIKQVHISNSLIDCFPMTNCTSYAPLINCRLHSDVCPTCPVTHTTALAAKGSPTTREIGPWAQGLGAQECLVLPKASVLQQKADRIVMQQFSVDE